MLDPLEILKARIASSGLSQAQNAARFNVSKGYLCDVLKERRPVGPKLLKALGVTRETVYRRR